MRRFLTSTIILLSAALPLFGQLEPSAEEFKDLPRDLLLQIPRGFELISDNRKYLRPDIRQLPRWQRIWQGSSDGVIETIVRVPEDAWKTKSPKEIMGFAMSLSDPTLKTVSQRDYELEGVRAYSVSCFYDKPGGSSQRLDWFFVRPYIYMVVYLSSKPSSWDDPASKAFFQTIHFGSKK